MTTIADIVVATTIIDKLNFIMTNICFIFTAINTHYTTSKFEKTLKTKNKLLIESLNENCIYQKFNPYDIVKS